MEESLTLVPRFAPQAHRLMTEHAEILERVRAGDADGAVAALAEHLRAARAIA